MNNEPITVLQVLTERGLDAIRPFYSGVQQLKFSLVRMFVRSLAKEVGLEAVFKLPEELQNFPEDSWEILPKYKKMQDLGIVKSIAFERPFYHDEPQGFVTFIGVTLDKKREGKLGFTGVGRDMLKRRLTMWPALGEALERWAIDTYEPQQGESLVVSYKNLTESKLNIFKIAGFSNELRSRPNSLYELAFSEDTPFTWVTGFSLITNSPVWLPLQLVSFKKSRSIQDTKEPLLSPSVSTGAAAGPNLKFAVTAGLLEVIERDAYMIYWLNKLSPKLIDPYSIPDPRFVQLMNIAERYRLEVYLQYLKTDIPVHTVSVVLVDKTGVGPAVVTSAATSFDLVDAAYRVLSSTLAIRQSHRNIYEQREEKSKTLNPNKLSHLDRILYYSRVEQISKIAFMITGESISFEQVVENTKHYARNQEELLEYFKKKDYQVVYKELISKKIKQALGGMTAVIVRVPELQPLHLEEEFPATSGPRLRDVPIFLGEKPASEVNTDPHPFP